jgi:c-di-GMP-binding flagellar brake protein YcgR
MGVKNMLSKYLAPGLKAEARIQWVGSEKKRPNDDEEYQGHGYSVKLQEILSEDELLITTPMVGTKEYPLPFGYEVDMLFYAKHGLFQCLCKVKKTVKENNVHLLQLTVISNLRKIQRREYYRMSCALELTSRELSPEEHEALEQEPDYALSKELPLRRSVIVDISGGGMRFLATQSYQVSSLIYCSYQLSLNGDVKKYELVGQVLDVRIKEDSKGVYEHRVQFVNISKQTREDIIKVIFELERQSRIVKK